MVDAREVDGADPLAGSLSVGVLEGAPLQVDAGVDRRRAAAGQASTSPPSWATRRSCVPSWRTRVWT